jgi:hypothetical protein
VVFVSVLPESVVNHQRCLEINERLRWFNWKHPSLIKIRSLYKFKASAQNPDRIVVTLAYTGAKLRSLIRVAPILFRGYALHRSFFETLVRLLMNLAWQIGFATRGPIPCRRRPNVFYVARKLLQQIRSHNKCS